VVNKIALLAKKIVIRLIAQPNYQKHREKITNSQRKPSSTTTKR
jgi:hypothetical protein